MYNDINNDNNDNNKNNEYSGNNDTMTITIAKQ